MKKIAIIVLSILLLILISVYLFIPRQIRIASHMQLPVSQEALQRVLANDSNWYKWWPGETNRNGDSITYLLSGRQYKLHDAKVLSLPVLISDGNFSLPAEMVLLKVNTDSVIIQVSAAISSSSNPISRVKDFFRAKKIKSDFSKLLSAINNHYSITKNLYGYDIQKQRVIDSTLLMNFREMKKQPAAEDIYSLVDELKAYIQKEGAKETGLPMLNIFTNDSVNYMLKVAIPVDRKLPPSGNMSYKWMLGGGNILITEVKGGQQEIEKAYKQIQLYIADYNRVAPAIPFESLVTDRRQEKDSTKWVTRIYYPVM